MPIVEAMYFELPLILSDIPVIHEVSKNTGIYFNPFSFEELSSIMLNFSEKHIAITTLKLDTLLHQYSDSETSGKYLQLINSL